MIMCVFILNGTIGNAIDWPCITNSRMSTIVDAGGPFYRLVNRQMEGYDTVAAAIGDVGDVVGAGTVAGEVRISDGIIVVRKFIGANEDSGIDADSEDVELTGCRGLALRSRVSGIHRVGLETDGRLGSRNSGAECIAIEVAAITASPVIKDVGDAGLADSTDGVVRTVARTRVSRRYREVQIRMNRNLNRIGITHTAGICGAIAQPSAVPRSVFVPIIGIDHIVNGDEVVIGSNGLV